MHLSARVVHDSLVRAYCPPWSQAVTARITPASTVTRGGQTEGNVQEDGICKQKHTYNLPHH